jgi:BolA protein
MSMQERIENKLLEHLAPERMRLANESYQHNFPKGSETHWNLIIVSERFEALSLVDRQRLVYKALGDELRAGIHALTMKTLSPKEWDDAGGEVTNPAPRCLGGSKASSSNPIS